MKKILLLTAIMATFIMQSCLKTDELWGGINDLKDKIAQLESGVSALNDNTQALYELKKKDVVVLGVTKTTTGYTLELSDGKKISVVLGQELPTLVPTIGIDKDGYWIYSLDGEEYKQLLVDGKPVEAYPSYDGEQTGYAPLLKVDKDGYWLVSYDNGANYIPLLDNGKQVVASGDKITYSGFFEKFDFDEATGRLDIKLKDGSQLTLLVKDNFGIKIGAPDPDTFMAGETRFYEVEQTNVKEIMIKAPQGWSAVLEESLLTVTSPGVVAVASDEVISVIAVSEEGFIRSVNINIKLTTEQYDANAAVAWNKFKTNAADNVLLDFSYAGYKRGEVSTPNVWAMGLKTFNVLEYGATPNDAISDRAAFIAARDAAVAAKGGIIYFPRGRYILHDATDDVGGKSVTIAINADNIILKGDGRDESIIEMAAPNQPNDPTQMWSSPSMIQIKHNTGVVYGTTLAAVTGDAAKGSFTVTSGATGSVKVDSWVCLRLKSNNSDVVKAELGNRATEAAGWDISTDGVNVEELHKVKSKTATTITFYEPVMYDVKQSAGWTIHEFKNYTNVGVEDLCFEGHSKENFVHHGSWEDDGAYKPIDFFRLTDSWMRRLKFVNVSEASSIITSANVTVADIIVEGNRGHSSIRSQGSSRVFIGKVIDRSHTINNGSIITQGSGQYHGTGVSKPSIGAVLWNNDWGTESCFESHATQPRATLFDICTGGFMNGRAGGDESQLPNHLGDLTMWNFNAKNQVASDFKWWDTGWWKLKILSPIIVGFQGSGATPFADSSADQIKYIEASGTMVTPHSLYEAQLRKRLGYVPAWLNALK